MSVYKTELQITQQPQSNTSIKYKEAVTISVSATGADNLSYRWKKDGIDVYGDHCQGADTPTLTICEFLADDQGKYMCVIKNCNDSVESEQAELALGMLVLLATYKYFNYY